MLNIKDAETEYLLTLMRCALKEEQVPAPPESLNWKRLIQISKKQQIYSMLIPVIDLKLLPEEQAQELNSYSKSELVRMIAVQNMLASIEETLGENKIKYMLLKGSVIRNYYPKQSMRQMTDIDILYDPAERERLISLMKAKGFYLKSAEANSDDFFKNPYYNFEFHRNLFDERDDFCPNFDLWKRAVQSEDSSCKYLINKEDCFIYSLCHTFDHYCVSGCGIRFVADIYVLINKLDNLDFDYINKTVEDFGFADFCKNVIGLSKVIFDGKAPTAEEQNLFDFMISGGVYGNNDFSKAIEESGSKLKYLIKRIFPPKRQMLGNYPMLQRAPFLLPFYYIFRLIQRAYYNFGSIKKELKSLKSYHPED